MDQSEFVAKVKAEPQFFCERVLGDKLWPLQAEIINSVRDNKDTSVRSCHGSGKTFLAARAALWFLYTRPKSLVITTAPTNRQVEHLLWKEINAAFAKRQSILGGKCLSKKLELDKDWFALGFAAREFTDASRTATGFQGFHAESILAIVDEASGVPKSIFDAIDGILSSADSHMLRIGNPTDPNGEFGRSFRDTKVRRFHISAFDTPNFTDFGITIEDLRSGDWEKKTGEINYPALITPQWVADKLRPEKWGEASPQWTAKVMGDFPELGTDTLIPLQYIEAARERELSRIGDIELGVDVARFGDNETVIVGRQGPVAWIEKRMRAQDTMQTAGEVAALIRKINPSIVRVDEIGVGGGVVDALRTDGHACVVGVNVGSSASKPDEWVNLRAELYWELRGFFERGEIALEGRNGMEDLEAQLSGMKFKYTARKGQIQIESKDDMRKRGMASPDLADALCLAFGGGYGSVLKEHIIWGKERVTANPSNFW